MQDKNLPEWLLGMEDEDLSFIRNFIVASGSLKEVAAVYGVTYPTVRLRLDRLIQKIQLKEQREESKLVHIIKELAMNDKLDFDTAKMLISAYRQEKEEELV